MPDDPYTGNWSPVPSLTLFGHAPTGRAELNGTLHLYAVGADACLYHNYAGYQGLAPTWVGWYTIASQATGTAAVVRAVAGTYDVFFVGLDSTLWHVAYANGGWSTPVSLGGQLHPGVSAVGSGQGRIDIVGRGLDGRMWYLTGTSAGFGPWQPREGALFSTPSLVAWSSSELQMVALGPAGDLLHQWYIKSTGEWSGWQTLHEQLTSAPVMVAASETTLDIFFRGSDCSLRHRSWDGGWGDSSSSLGGLLAGAPVAAADPETGRIEVLTTQLDHNVGRVYRDGGFGTITSQGCLTAASPLILLLAEQDQIAEVALGPDGVIRCLVRPW